MSRITLTEKYVPEGNIIIYSNDIGKSRKERIFEVEWGVAELSKINILPQGVLAYPHYQKFN